MIMEEFDFVGEIKKLALKAHLDKDFCRIVVTPPTFFEEIFRDFPLSRLAKKRNYTNKIKIADDFAQFLERLVEDWRGDLRIDSNHAVQIIIDSIESNTFWWLADRNNSRDPYKVTIAIFESINYLCWHDHYCIVIDENTLQRVLGYPKYDIRE